MSPHRCIPKSAWRTITSWSQETWQTIADHLKIELSAMEPGVNKRKPWACLVNETDFCGRCSAAYSTEKNPKMVGTCGHISCARCHDDDAVNRWSGCYACKRKTYEKVTKRHKNHQFKPLDTLLTELPTGSRQVQTDLRIVDVDGRAARSKAPSPSGTNDGENA
jgi:hypothetical protein